MEPPELCPKCNGKLMTQRKGPEWIVVCWDEDCRYICGNGVEAMVRIMRWAKEIGVEGKLVMISPKVMN